MDQHLKKELVEYVLRKSPVWLFNEATKAFSTQRLYSRCKRDLLTDYAHVMPNVLSYAIVMADVFRGYQSPEIECLDLRYTIDQLKYKIKLARKYGTFSQMMVDQHNTLVERYTELIKPQQKLIKLYRKINKNLDV